MSIASGCGLTDSQALCALNNYISDLSWTCPMGIIWNATYNTRICSIALMALSFLKVIESSVTVYCESKGKRINTPRCLCWSTAFNLLLITVAALTVLAACMSKNNPDWIRQFWNDEINNCNDDD